MMGEIDEVDGAGSLESDAGRPRAEIKPGQGLEFVTAAQTGGDPFVYADSGETILVVETNIDDMNTQVYGFVMERLFAVGALDVFMTPIQMKKDRPGVLLTVLSRPETADAIIETLLTETTTLGVRYYEARRRVLERIIETVETRYGAIRIKVARDGARTLHFQPEYDDCARVAVAVKAPFLEVHAAAAAAYRIKAEAD